MIKYNTTLFQTAAIKFYSCFSKFGAILRLGVLIELIFPLDNPLIDVIVISNTIKSFKVFVDCLQY